MSESHDPTGLDLAAEIAHQVARTSPLLPEAPAAPPPKVPKRRRFAGEQRSGAHPDDRDPQLIGSVLEGVAKRRGWRKQLSLSMVLRDWAGLVGQANAEHSQPVQFLDGVLTVQCDSTAWASAMKFNASALVARLNRELGDRSVLRIEFLGPRAPSWKKGRRSVPGRGPRDTYG
ncbi:MAG: DciA family protein [Propionibacteriaceae bacterium]|nr:DciA family protein [Propionibacteriaceae bacterium]